MKVSEITINDVAFFLKLDGCVYSETQLRICLKASVDYVKAYTGLDDAGLDEYEDITIAVLILCSDMYDNRSVYTEQSSNLNQLVEKILDLHRTSSVSA